MPKTDGMDHPQEIPLFINHGGVQKTKLKCLNVRKLMLDKMNKSLNANIVRKNHVHKLFLTALIGTFVIHPRVIKSTTSTIK